MDGLCKIFESYLKHQNPGSRNITYDVKDLFNYIDELPDLGLLMYAYPTSLAHSSLMLQVRLQCGRLLALRQELDQAARPVAPQEARAAALNEARDRMNEADNLDDKEPLRVIRI